MEQSHCNCIGALALALHRAGTLGAFVGMSGGGSDTRLPLPPVAYPTPRRGAEGNAAVAELDMGREVVSLGGPDRSVALGKRMGMCPAGGALGSAAGVGKGIAPDGGALGSAADGGALGSAAGARSVWHVAGGAAGAVVSRRRRGEPQPP